MVVMVDQPSRSIQDVHTENRHLEYRVLTKGLARDESRWRQTFSKLRNFGSLYCSFAQILIPKNYSTAAEFRIKHVEARGDCF